MKQRCLVKVIGTVMIEDNGRLATEIARGISLLRRGQTLFDFISVFLTDRHIKTFTLHQRAEKIWATSIMSLNDEPKKVVSYHFIEFEPDDIGYHAKDLTKEELERDMKPLTKYLPTAST